MTKENPFANKTRLATALLFAVFLSGVAAAGSVIIQNGQINASSNLNAGNALFVNPTTGYVGIGTATSSRPLQIAAIQDANIRLQDTSSSAPAAYVEFYNDTTRWGYVGLGGHDDKMVVGTTAEKNLSFYTNDSEKMVLTAGGYVGIGTASPSVPLHVVSTSNGVYSDIYTDSAGLAGAFFVRKARGTVSSPAAIQAEDAIGGIYGAGYYGAAFGGNIGAIRIVASENFTSTNQGSYIDFATTANGSTGRITRMKIDGSGNVGIGTTSPGALLQIEKDATSEVQNLLDLKVSSGSSSTTFPSTAMNFWSVEGSATEVKTSTLYSKWDSNNYQDSRLTIMGHIDQSGTVKDVLTIKNGNVGIGTTSPNARLSLGSSYLSNGTAGNSFDVYIPIASFDVKNADAATLNTNADNGNNELTLGAGTDLFLMTFGDFCSGGGADQIVASPWALAPTGYSVKARVVFVGDANLVSDSDYPVVSMRYKISPNEWSNFTFKTGYDHQWYNARYTGVTPWQAFNPVCNIASRLGYNAVYLGVRSDSSYGLVYTRMSVQVAYVKT